MKRSFVLMSVCLMLYLTSCMGSTSGPQVWVDQPLEENNPVNTDPLILQAHASDVEGVANILFFVDNTEIQRVTTGGERLGSATVEWTPPGPGTYVIQVKASNHTGIMGAPARVVVIVRDEITEPKEENETPDESILPTPSLSPTTTPSLSPTTTPSPPTVTPSITPKLDTHTPSPPPTITPTPDTIAPVIFSITLSPSEITVDSSGCTGEPRTSTSTLDVYDAGGIAEVKANWSIGDESGMVYYSTEDGTTFSGTFGSVSTHGTMEINGVVIDNAGNETPFVHSLTVNLCID